MLVRKNTQLWLLLALFILVELIPQKCPSPLLIKNLTVCKMGHMFVNLPMNQLVLAIFCMFVINDNVKTYHRVQGLAREPSECQLVLSDSLWHYYTVAKWKPLVNSGINTFVVTCQVPTLREVFVNVSNLHMKIQVYCIIA